jgi:cation diffusion facilitator family transporter
MTEAAAHDHAHDHDHEHEHGHHRGGVVGALQAVFHLHGHAHMDDARAADPAFETSEGIRTVWIALAALGVTSLIQILIVFASGSVALLADTVHNIGDFLNSVPLLVAFYLSRRLATRRYTYGFGRAEDVAGIFIVISIVFSAGYILWESINRLFDPQPIKDQWWVVAAAIVGALGNEAVAWFQIRTGRRIGSEALVADGLHARIDGMTSLAVLIAVIGSALGAPILDPIIGLLIGIAIVFVAKDATIRIWYRLMDAVDPTVIDDIEHEAGHVSGIVRVGDVRARWVGHRLHAEISVGIDPGVTRPADVAEVLRSQLLASVKHLERVTVEVMDTKTVPVDSARS